MEVELCKDIPFTVGVNPNEKTSKEVSKLVKALEGTGWRITTIRR